MKAYLFKTEWLAGLHHVIASAAKQQRGAIYKMGQVELLYIRKKSLNLTGYINTFKLKHC